MTDSRAASERHWWVTYSCGHEEEITTFIGDFDYERAHRDLPDICRFCRLDPKAESPIVHVVAAELIDMDARAQLEFEQDELRRRR